MHRRGQRGRGAVAGELALAIATSRMVAPRPPSSVGHGQGQVARARAGGRRPPRRRCRRVVAARVAADRRPSSVGPGQRDRSRHAVPGPSVLRSWSWSWSWGRCTDSGRPRPVRLSAPWRTCVTTASTAQWRSGSEVARRPVDAADPAGDGARQHPVQRHRAGPAGHLSVAPRAAPRHLERKGVVELRPSPTGRGNEYHLTDGRPRPRAVIMALGRVVGPLALRRPAPGRDRPRHPVVVDAPPRRVTALPDAAGRHRVRLPARRAAA